VSVEKEAAPAQPTKAIRPTAQSPLIIVSRI
jgi:hypothetical protein